MALEYVVPISGSRRTPKPTVRHIRSRVPGGTETLCGTVRFARLAEGDEHGLPVCANCLGVKQARDKDLYRGPRPSA